MLEELVLGSDGNELPLVVVEGRVEGGAAAEHAAETEANGGGASVIAGDTIIAVYGSTGSFNVEATSYESTIGAIGALAQAGAPLTLTLGRIVRRGRAAVTTVDRDGSESQFVCYEGENLRMGLLRRGLRLNDQTARRYDNKPKGTGRRLRRQRALRNVRREHTGWQRELDAGRGLGEEPARARRPLEAELPSVRAVS